MEDKRIDLLENQKISKAINHMALPAIVGFLVMAVYNIVDTMFVSWLGKEATSATQVVLPIMMLVSAFGLAFGIGAGSYASRLLGMHKKDKADEVASVAFITSFSVGIIFSVISVLMIRRILTFFGADASIMDMSVGYGRFILMGSMFTMGNMNMNNLLRSEGSAKLSMVGMAAGSVVNIFLDPFFIFVLDMGTSGAALATMISQGISFSILISHYLRKTSVLHIGFSHYKPTAEIWSQIAKIGIPTFFRQVLFSISLAFLNKGAMTYGSSDLLAAVGINYKIMLIPIYFIFGIGQGFQPVAGYNFGAKNKERVLSGFRYTVLACLFIALISGFIYIAFDDWVLGIFKPIDSVKAYGIIGIRFSVAAIIFMAISNPIAIFFQAIGRGGESLVLSVARQGIFYLPAILYLPLAFGANGILASQLCADVLAFIVSLIMFSFYYFRKNLDRDIVAQA